MKYKTHNDININYNGTGLQGYIIISYEELVNIFGNHQTFDDYKTDAQWIVKFSDGVVATIYNYKNGVNYLGEDYGVPTKYITEWNVGGKTDKVVSRINNIIKKGTK